MSKIFYMILESFLDEKSPLIVPRPANFTWLCKHTHFNTKQLRRLYRYFKEICPYGVLDEQTWQTIYKGIFPKGNSENYAHYVFRAFDLNKDTYLCFEDIAEVYSILTRGSPLQKIKWLFNFYDINEDGRIGRLELLDVVKSFYSLHSEDDPDPSFPPHIIFNHVISIFQNIAGPKQHYITKVKFEEHCLKNPTIVQNLFVFSPNLVVFKE